MIDPGDGGTFYPAPRRIFALPIGPTVSSPVIGRDGTIYVGTTDGKLVKHRQDGSGTNWSTPTNDTAGSSPALGQDGTIYVGSSDDKLYALTSDGAVKWSLDLGSPAASSPAVGGDGTIYVGCADGKLHSVAQSSAPSVGRTRPTVQSRARPPCTRARCTSDQTTRRFTRCRRWTEGPVGVRDPRRGRRPGDRVRRHGISRRRRSARLCSHIEGVAVLRCEREGRRQDSPRHRHGTYALRVYGERARCAFTVVLWQIHGLRHTSASLQDWSHFVPPAPVRASHRIGFASRIGSDACCDSRLRGGSASISTSNSTSTVPSSFAARGARWLFSRASSPPTRPAHPFDGSGDPSRECPGPTPPQADSRAASPRVVTRNDGRPQRSRHDRRSNEGRGDNGLSVVGALTRRELPFVGRGNELRHCALLRRREWRCWRYCRRWPLLNRGAIRMFVGDVRFGVAVTGAKHI